MSFLEEIDEGAAVGRVAEHYESERSSKGYLPNYVKAFSTRPEVYDAWGHLIGAIKANMDLRRYELVTLAAARELRSSYCSLAHGKVLLDKFLDEDSLRDLVVAQPDNVQADDELDQEGHRAPRAIDRAVMNLAAKVAADAPAVTEADIDALRRLGLPDDQILDVVLAAAARAFFTKVLDGIGTRPDGEYRGLLGEDLADLLAVGRPVEDRA